MGGSENKSSPLPSHCLNHSFIDTLAEPLLGIARECIPLEDKTNKGEALSKASIRADVLEIQLRSQLLSLVNDYVTSSSDSTAVTDGASIGNNSNDNKEALEDVGIYWERSLEICLHMVYFADDNQDERYKGIQVRKLPLLLLEDALDALPLGAFQSLWQSVVEPSYPILFSDLLWHPNATFPCALPFIKLCNKFLKKLTNTNTANSNEWPGRILLTLAKAFPLSDKSATKIWGSFNTDNVTEFETSEQFEQEQQEQLQQQQQTDTSSSTTTSKSLHHKHQNKELQTYSFYETFWAVQRDFSNPSGIKVAEFLDRMKKILAALESHPLIRTSAIATSGNKDNNNTPKDDNTKEETTDADDDNQQPPVRKYLTSSQLLPIQLGDPIFRIHFLTQFLIVENHLSSESSALGTALLPLQKRAKDLLRHIQPLGASHLQIVSSIINQREVHWRQWKKNKCQPDLDTPLNNTQDDSKNRKRLSDGPLGFSSAPASRSSAPAFKKPKKKDEEELLFDFILHEKKDLKATCGAHESSSSNNSNDKKKQTVPPALEDHLESYVDALDPESGIEAEYHPKNDSLFTWRALRLLSKDHLGKFHMITHKGDFENMVRKIWSDEKGIEIPGQAAEAEDLMLVEEDEAVAASSQAEEEDEEENEEMTPVKAEPDQAAVEKEEDDKETGESQQTQDSGDKDQEMEDANNGDRNVKEDEGEVVDDASADAAKIENERAADSADKYEADEQSPAIVKNDTIKSEDDYSKDHGDGAKANPDGDDAPMDAEPAKDVKSVPSKEEPALMKQEPTASTNDSEESDDEGEIEEGKASQRAAPDEQRLQSSSSNDDKGPPSRRRSRSESEGPASSSKPRHHHGGDGEQNQQQHNQQADRRGDDDRGDSRQQQQHRRGGGHGPNKGRRDRDPTSNRPPSPQQHRASGGGNRGGHRERSDGRNNDNDRQDGPPQGSGYGSHGDHSRGGGQSRQHRGSDGHQRGGQREHGGGGGRGGGSGSGGGRPSDGGGGRRDDRGTDERWEDRRGGGGGGSGGQGRRDDRRGGGGHRQNERRGGRGDGGRRRYR
ncbi:tHO complex [Seminavis robusta]|uniref:THO complex n=1 Tax=Seminavis robusta TaxID=568900 RepID=A0A9N8HSV3_9STRA|nr:tHO complex [Seminavis robusta]|eukprot:Sro1203_g252100.1 tHO complex (1062) ;mRNA; r:19706-22891